MTAAAELSTARPALRGDLVLGPAVRDGAGWTHTVKDPRSNWYFQVGPREFFIMSRLDGQRSLGEIGGEYAEHFGRRLAQPHWGQLLGMLAARHLLAGTDDAASIARMAEAARRQRRGTQTLLYRRFTLTDPDRLFGRLEPWLRILFSPWFVLPALVTALALEGAMAFAAPALYHQVRADWHYPPAWIGYVLVMWAGLFVHEVAHGVTSKHFSGVSSEIGILWRFPFLAPYCKADDVLLFPSKWHRVYTAFAGVFANLLLLAPFCLAWLLTPAGSRLHVLCAPLILFGSVAALANLWPFLQLDGYYMLSHSLGMVNLRKASQRYWAQLGRRLIGRPGPQPAYPPRARAAYLAYGAVSFLFIAAAAGWATTAAYLWLARRAGPAAALGVLGAATLALVLTGMFAARRAAARTSRQPADAAEAVRQLDAAAAVPAWGAIADQWRKQ
jgi:putative peptide zinc metalloprotease protein